MLSTNVSAPLPVVTGAAGGGVGTGTVTGGGRDGGVGIDIAPGIAVLSVTLKLFGPVLPSTALWEVCHKTIFLQLWRDFPARESQFDCFIYL